MVTFITKIEIEVEAEVEIGPKRIEILCVRDTTTGKQIFGLSPRQIFKLEQDANDAFIAEEA